MRAGALVCCVLASTSAHVALLALALPAMPLPGARAGDADRRAIIARMVLLPPAPASAQPTTPPIAVATAESPLRSAVVGGVDSHVEVPLTTLPSDAPPPLAGTRWAEAANEPARAAAGDDFDGYIPRELLTVPPVLQSTVLLDSPDQPEGHYRGIFLIYIDDTGVVRRVEAEGDALPTVLADRARQAFLGAHFEPGQLEGRIVKSRLRIAVDFEHRTAASSKRF